MLRAMNVKRMLQLYGERAKEASSATERTVNVLAMMCAAAVYDGRFHAFAGPGLGGDWPDPRESTGDRENGSDASVTGGTPTASKSATRPKSYPPRIRLPDRLRSPYEALSDLR
jgi:hypothetical protein